MVARERLGDVVARHGGKTYAVCEGPILILAVGIQLETFLKKEFFQGQDRDSRMGTKKLHEGNYLHPSGWGRQAVRQFGQDPGCRKQISLKRSNDVHCPLVGLVVFVQQGKEEEAVREPCCHVEEVP